MLVGKWLSSLPVNVSYGVPSVADDVPKELVELGGMQWILQDERDLMPLVGVIERADDQQIEAARPLLYHAMEMIREVMRTRSFQHGYDEMRGLLSAVRDEAGIVDAILKTAPAEAMEHMQAAEERPGHLPALQGVAAGLKILGEAKVITSAMAFAGGARERAWADQAASDFNALAARSDRLRSGVGPLYEGTVHRIVPASHEVEAQAAMSSAEALARPEQDIGSRRVGLVIDLTGDHEPGRKRVAQWKGLYHEPSPLTPDDARHLRAEAAAVLAEYDQTYHRPGFVNLLQQAAGMLRWDAVATVDRETVASPGIRAQVDWADSQRELLKPVSYNRDFDRAQAAIPVEEHEARIRNRQGSALRKAASDLALADAISALCAKAAVAMHVEPPLRTVVLDRRPDMMVARFEHPRPGDKSLIILPERGRKKQKAGYEDAVYAVVAGADTVVGRAPELEAVRDGLVEGYGVGANFRNLEDLLASLNDPRMQDMVFGGPVAIAPSPSYAPTAPSAAGP